MKYIDADKIRSEVERIQETGCASPISVCNDILSFIDSLQQEPTPDTDILHTELVNLLKIYRIGEETARTMADRIADTYGSQRYMDGLCDGLKQEQPEVDLEKIIEQTYHDGSVADTDDMDQRNMMTFLPSLTPSRKNPTRV